MAKCNTQANDMATTANNWQTPGATDPGRYRKARDQDLVVGLEYLGLNTRVCGSLSENESWKCRHVLMARLAHEGRVEGYI